MNEYTSEELNMLIDSIVGLNESNVRFSLDKNPTVDVIIRGKITALSCDLLIKIVLNNPTLYFENQYNIFCKEMYAFIYYIPLEEVPLYIQTMPKIAKWRLKIGK